MPRPLTGAARAPAPEIPPGTPQPALPEVPLGPALPAGPLHLSYGPPQMPQAPAVTAWPREDSWFLRMTLPRLERERARRKQPEPQARPVEEARPEEARAAAEQPDPADPNSRGCQGPYTRVITYTRTEFHTLTDPVDDSTPVT